MRFQLSIVLVFCLVNLFGFSQEAWLQPNEGQWDERIDYKVDLQMGEILIEQHGFTFFLNDSKQTFRHSHDSDTPDENTETYKAHVIKSTFLGSSWERDALEKQPSIFYKNYILGNNPSNWKGNVYSYTDVLLIDYYPGIDMRLDGSDGLKYSFELAPNTDASVIQISYEGQSGIRIDDKGQLILKNRFGEIIEGKPVAWVEGEKGREEVEIEYILINNTIHFEFPNGYDFSKKLILDPSLTFSTFTGSTADNWGTSATPDPSGNLFGGGVVFGIGYPISVGVFDALFNGGSVDIGLTKFTADGTGIIYSTYIGGNGSETANSMICSSTGELFIFGLTSSSNFPMAGASYDNSFAGGPNVSTVSNGLGFSAGTDLFVLRLNSAGSALIASTYVGGTGTDGLNSSSLKYNYGDQFRGEIILDGSGSLYVASMTQSTNFPTLGGGQLTMNGTQDAVLFKMPISLNALSWSTYFGGGNVETGNSVQVSSTGEVYMAGGTISNNVNFNSSGFDLTYGGGLSDGYVARFNSLNGSVLSGSYIGNNEYDQTYFVQLDIEDNVYVLGQTESDLGITAGLWGVINSGQFIHKYSNDLTTQTWKTMVGAGIGHVEISPTAFLISDCHDIYFSGWGGTLNQNASISQASFSTTNGFPVTFDAYQATTTGSNFYIAVLSQDAGYLKYGTFMGGNTTSPDHVDGGTSRFDKNGNIYHAVCAACDGQPNGFTTTPGVYSPTNNSTNCNLAAFKFELSTIEAIVANPAPVVCIPDPVIFTNNSSNGNDFFWDFGDGDTSVLINPTHFYTTSGNYDVTLIVSDTNGCYLNDTVVFNIVIGDYSALVTQPPSPVCPNVPYQLNASNGVNYQWSPGQYLNDSTVANPIATVSQTTIFTVIVSDTCGIDTLQITLEVFNLNNSVSNDTAVCIGNSVQLNATGGGSYFWTPNSSLSNGFIANPISTPSSTTNYIVEITTPELCVIEDSILVEVFFNPPVPIIDDTLILCLGETGMINVAGGDSYFWSPNINILPVFGPVVSVSPQNDMYYYCNFVNICGSVLDSIFVDVKSIHVEAENDTILCPGNSTTLSATGAINYLWAPGGSLNVSDSSVVIATPYSPTYYYVYGTGEFGCKDHDSVFVNLFPLAEVTISGATYANIGDEINLSASSTTVGYFTWEPSDFLSCTNCPITLAQPNQDFTYTVHYIDSNGCGDTNSITILYPSFYVPNSFTPDGDAFNNTFFVQGEHVRDFHLEIFNRWGELIFESFDINIGWDGTYHGHNSQDGTYVWKISAKLADNQSQSFVGHVSLIR